MPKATKNLWQNEAFMKLWFGESISLLGSQITFLALPLVAALTLGASPLEMGVLGAIGALPALFLALPAGILVDRMQRQRILVICDLARAFLLVLIPVIAWFGYLNFPLLLLISFGVGCFNILFSIAYRAYLPGLVAESELIEGNSKLEISRSGAEIGGPGLGGLLVQLLSPPFAILFDALSFLASAIFIGSIKTPSGKDATRLLKRPSLRAEIGEGFAVIRESSTLRVLLVGLTNLSLFNHALEAVLVLFVIRDLGVAPGWLGLIFGAGNLGFLLGAIWVGFFTARLGAGRTTALALLVATVGDLFIVLAGGDLIVVVIMLLLAQFLFGFGLTIFNINQISLRQSSAPNELQGRVNSVFTWASQGIAPIGAFTGGVIGTVLDLRLTLLVAVLGEILTALWMLTSPLAKMKSATD